MGILHHWSDVTCPRAPENQTRSFLPAVVVKVATEAKSKTGTTLIPPSCLNTITPVIRGRCGDVPVFLSPFF